MQDVIVQDSKKTLMLRATFMKLSSIMNAPMNRLQIAKYCKEIAVYTDGIMSKIGRATCRGRV